MSCDLCNDTNQCTDMFFILQVLQVSLLSKVYKMACDDNLDMIVTI